MKKIVLAGGTGHIGQSLSAFLIAHKYKVIVLSRQHRSNQSGIEYIHWDGSSIGAWQDALEEIDVLINLSGRSVQCRFTEANKQELYDSRIIPTKLLGEAIGRLAVPPRLWINFSGISIFEGVEKLNDENSQHYGAGFLAELTGAWEQAFFAAKTDHTEKVCLRVSPVLSRQYGMFKELYPLARLGLGGTVAHGRQLISWIHEVDLLRLINWIIMHEKPSFIYHACVPEPIANIDFMKTMRKTVGQPIGLPLPRFFAKIGAFFKGVESDMLLKTNAVKTTKVVDEGFSFLYPTAAEAFNQLISKDRF